MKIIGLFLQTESYDLRSKISFESNSIMSLPQLAAPHHTSSAPAAGFLRKNINMIENSLIDPAVTQTQSGTSVLKRVFAAQKALGELDDVQFDTFLWILFFPLNFPPLDTNWGMSAELQCRGGTNERWVKGRRDRPDNLSSSKRSSAKAVSYSEWVKVNHVKS